jgi:hypothetical protein
MAQGDLTKENVYDKIEVVNQWNVQARKAVKVMEEQADGSKKEISRSFERFLYVPFDSRVSADGKTWTHTATDMSSVDATVKAIAESAWTDDVKTAYKTHRESQSIK